MISVCRELNASSVTAVSACIIHTSFTVTSCPPTIPLLAWTSYVYAQIFVKHTKALCVEETKENQGELVTDSRWVG